MSEHFIRIKHQSVFRLGRRRIALHWRRVRSFVRSTGASVGTSLRAHDASEEETRDDDEAEPGDESESETVARGPGWTEDDRRQGQQQQGCWGTETTTGGCDDGNDGDGGNCCDDDGSRVLERKRGGGAETRGEETRDRGVGEDAQRSRIRHPQVRARAAANLTTMTI